MDEPNDWLHQAKSRGNPEVYQRWVDLNTSSIAALAFQNGVPDNQSGKFQIEVFKRFHVLLMETDSLNADSALYRIASEILPGYTGTLHSSGTHDRFLFEEDQELHSALQQLALPNRVAFTLFHFHEKSSEELTVILSIEPAKLHSILETSFESTQKHLALEDRQMDKRLELLAKSYSRLELPSPEKKDPLKAGPAIEHLQTTKTRPGKKVTAVLVSTCLLLGSLVTASFVMDGTETTGTDDEEETADTIEGQVEKWKERYNSIKNNSPQEMGISAEVYDELSYVSEADHLISRILSEENLEVMKGDSLALEKQFVRVLFHIETPQGMVDLLDEHPLSSDETDQFIYTFANKTEELMQASNKALLEYNAEFADAIEEGELSVTELLSNAGNYTEEASNLIKGLDEQMLTIIQHPTEARFIARRDLTPLYGVSSIMNDWTVSSNLMILGNEPFFDSTGLLVSLEEAAYRLTELEHYLLDEHSRSMLYTDFTDKFQQLFWLVLKGSKDNPVFSDAETVKEEYRQAWNLIAESRKNPILSVMLPILDDFEETDWQSSKHYEELSPMQITYAMQMEMVGYLADDMPNGHMVTQPEFIDMAGFSYEDSEELYNQFKVDYNKTLLSGRSPSEIYFLYQYANRMEDPETMWHLMSEDRSKPDQQEFLERWQKLPDIAETARWLEYTEESFYRSGKNIVVQLNINYADEISSFQEGPRLVTSENDVWLLSYRYSEIYTSEQMNEDFREKIQTLYQAGEWEGATPAEVVGLVLIAKEQSDYKALESLTEEFHHHQFSSDFEELMKSLELPLFAELLELAFISDPFDEAVGREMGRVYMNSPSEPYSNVFSMIETPAGWKLAY